MPRNPDKEKPTIYQFDYLTSLGIQVPQTKRRCTQIITFLLQGNGLSRCGRTVGERVTYLREQQAQFVGKRATYCPGDTPIEKGIVGTIREVYPLSTTEIARECRNGVPLENMRLLTAVFEVPGDRARVKRIHLLHLIEGNPEVERS